MPTSIHARDARSAEGTSLLCSTGTPTIAALFSRGSAPYVVCPSPSHLPLSCGYSDPLLPSLQAHTEQTKYFHEEVRPLICDFTQQLAPLHGQLGCRRLDCHSATLTPCCGSYYRAVKAIGTHSHLPVDVGFPFLSVVLFTTGVIRRCSTPFMSYTTSQPTP